MDGNKENEVMILTDEDGKEVEFEFIANFEFEGNTYYALVPVEDNKDGEYVILKLEKAEEGDEDAILSTIDDDDEFDRVADYFEDEYLSEIDYDEEEK